MLKYIRWNYLYLVNYHQHIELEVHITTHRTNSSRWLSAPLLQIRARIINSINRYIDPNAASNVFMAKLIFPIKLFAFFDNRVQKKECGSRDNSSTVSPYVFNI